jgi:hypothetical protein
MIKIQSIVLNLQIKYQQWNSCIDLVNQFIGAYSNFA